MAVVVEPLRDEQEISHGSKLPQNTLAVRQHLGYNRTPQALKTIYWGGRILRNKARCPCCACVHARLLLERLTLKTAGGSDKVNFSRR